MKISVISTGGKTVFSNTRMAFACMPLKGNATFQLEISKMSPQVKNPGTSYLSMLPHFASLFSSPK